MCRYFFKLFDQNAGLAVESHRHNGSSSARPSDTAIHFRRNGLARGAHRPSSFPRSAKKFGIKCYSPLLSGQSDERSTSRMSDRIAWGFRCAAADWRISFNNKAIARLKGHNFHCRVWPLCLLTLEFRRFPSCQHSQYLGLNLVYWNIRCLLNLAVVHRFDFHWSAIPTECIIACAQLHHVLRDCQGQSEVILAFHQRTGRLVSGVE